MAQLLAAGLISMYDILLPPDIKGLSVLLIFSNRKILGELCIFMFIFILTFCFFLFLSYFHFNDHCFTVLYMKKKQNFSGALPPWEGLQRSSCHFMCLWNVFFVLHKTNAPIFFSVLSSDWYLIQISQH